MNKNKLVALVAFSLVVTVICAVCCFCYFKSKAVVTNNVVIESRLFTVSTSFEGIVKEVFVKPNENISSGQVIAEIEVEQPAAKQIVVDNNKLELTKKNLDEAEKNYTNFAMMYKDGVISQKEYDESLEKLVAARENYKKEVANKHQASAPKANAMTRKVHSPEDGVVSVNYVKKGETVNVHKPILLADFKTPNLIAYFDPKFKDELSVGKKVIVKSSQYRGKSFEGVIESVSDKSNVISSYNQQMVPVKIRLLGDLKAYNFDKKFSFKVSVKD